MNRSTRALRLQHMQRAQAFIVAIQLLFFSAASCSAQSLQVLSNDRRALVERREVEKAYVIQAGKETIIWIALDPVSIAESKNGVKVWKPLHAGDSATIRRGTKTEFRSSDGSVAHIITIKTNKAQNELRAQPFDISNGLQDASSGNKTLLVAISKCRFQDIHNRGDESQWIPAKPEVVSMNAHSVRWIPAGIHHFKNLKPIPPKIVEIEW